MKIFLVLLALLSLKGHSKVLYGEDDRQDTVEVTDPLFLELAQTSAAMIHKNRISVVENKITFFYPSLMERHNLCMTENFVNQPAVASCSGTLVNNDIIVTAGHCVSDQADCQNYVWVFNYKVKNPYDTRVTVETSDVYTCQKIIQQEYGTLSGNDFSVIKLDRRVVGQRVATLAKVIPHVGVPVVMIGHPSGIPQKITDNAQITKSLPTFFSTNLDAFQSNSGSGVFHAKTGELLGILVRGSKDYIQTGASCVEANILDSDGDEDATVFTVFENFIPKEKGTL